MLKFSRPFTLVIKGKSSFEIVGPMSHSIWIIDFGATNHVTPLPMLFNSYVKMIGEQLIKIANGDSVSIYGSKNITLD